MTILRLLDGAHFGDARGSFLVSLVMLALGFMQRQSSLVALWFALFALSAEAFYPARGSRDAVVVASRGAPPSGAAAVLRSLPAVLALALLLFLLVPRVTLGFFVFRGGIPAFTGHGVGLDDLGDLRLSNDVMMRVRLSRRANVYFRGRSFNIYSPFSRRWHAMPIRRADAPRGADGPPASRASPTPAGRCPTRAPLEQEYWLTAHLFGSLSPSTPPSPPPTPRPASRPTTRERPAGGRRPGR
jgi:hypothetical protein